MMKQSVPVKIAATFSLREIYILLNFIIPFTIEGFIGSISPFIITMFVGRLGEHALAANAVVMQIFFTAIFAVYGALASVVIMIAQQQGGNDKQKISQIFRDGILLALLLAIPATLLVLYIPEILTLAGQNPLVIEYSAAYVRPLAFGVLANLLGVVIHQMIIGFGNVRINVLFVMLSIVLQISCTYALMFGQFGLPTIGLAAVGWSFAIVSWAMLPILILYLVFNKVYRDYLSGMIFLGNPVFLKELWRIGYPMSLIYLVEFGYDLAFIILIGYFSTLQLAASQIAYQYLMVVFVFYMAFMQTMSLRIGHLLGSKELDLIKPACYISVCMVTSIMLLIALCYWFIPYILISIDIDIYSPENIKLITYAKQFLAISALCQLFDAVRYTLNGALRGMKDTRFCLLTTVLCFWVIALPAGYLFATQLKMEGVGLWWGMTLGTACSVPLLAWRLRFKIKYECSRVI